jgi:site-specific recombinase XerD
MELKEIVKEYEKHLLASGKRIKGSRHSVTLFNRYLGENNLDILSLNYREACGFQSWLTCQNGRYAAASILNIIGSLSAFYNYLWKRRLTAFNPFSLIDRIKCPSRIPKNIPDEKELDALLSCLRGFTRGKNLRDYKSHYKAHVLCELLYSTGMRISEAAALKVCDIDLSRGTVVVHDSKTRKERTAFLNEYSRGVLSVYMNELREKVLWLHNGGDPSLLFGCSVNLITWLNGVLSDLCREMGREKVTSHIFRHAFGYHMLRSGCDIRKIQKFLGHERLNTTQVYTRVDTEALRNVLDHYHPRKRKTGESL